MNIWRRVCTPGWVLAILFTSAVWTDGQPPAYELRQLQIKALTRGNTAELDQLARDLDRLAGISDEITLYTAKWTSIAARLLAEANADVHHDSADFLSDFIHHGASEFVQRGAPPFKAFDAVLNLIRFINTEIEIGRNQDPARPPISENTFSNAKIKICPLWPFC